MKTFALLGNPNCGKTTLYNSLTGSTAHVGNWPGVTVEKRSGVYKKLKEPLEIIDLPGIYSLSPYTSEEVISRNYILDEHPACVINIIDATNLERNLYLTTQALEIDVPMVIALNMMDEIKKQGRTIDIKKLEAELGVPVVEISALKGQGIHELMQKAYKASLTARQGTIKTIQNKDLLHLIGDVTIAFKGNGVENPSFHAVKLVEKDEVEVKNHPQLLGMVQDFEQTFKDETFGNDFEALIADARYQYISSHFGDVVSAPKEKEANNKDKNKKMSKSDRADRILTNRWAGIPIFLVIMFLIFHLTFSENLFYFGGLLKANNVAPMLEGNEWFEGLIWTAEGINSPGVILANIVNGITGWLNSMVGQGLANANAPAWLSGLLCDGVLGGLFAVVGFLPQILVLFLFFAILEDSGYMARVAFLLDRIFRKFGLSGRSFLPMIMGFGCSVPAMINTRTLATEKEKAATLRVIPFFACSAKLPILTACAGAIAVTCSIPNPDVVTYGMYLLGMVTAIIMIILMRSTTMRGKVPPFIMELPAYHFPQFKSLMIHLWDKAKHFVKKAFTIILASTILIWFLSSFRPNWTMCSELVDAEGEFIGYDISESMLHALGQMITPIFTPLGFGSQLVLDYGWVFAVAAITGLIAKENVIATFGVLAASIVGIVAPELEVEGAASVYVMIQATQIHTAGLIAFIAFNMLTIPCFAAVATAKGETQKGKFKWTILFWLGTSYIVSGIVYGVGSAYEYAAWLGVIITLAVIGIGVGVGFIIHGYNKKHPIEMELA